MPCVLRVVAGVVAFEEGTAQGLLDFRRGVPGGSGGFVNVIAVEDVYDCACFSGEALLVFGCV